MRSSSLVGFMLGLAVAATVLAGALALGFVPQLTGGQPTPTPIADPIITPEPLPTNEPTPSTTAEPSPTPQLTLEPEPTPAVAPSPGGTYLVQSGDTLSKIGTIFGVPWLLIAEANGIAPPNYVIREGQELVIPAPEAICAPPERYLIQSGDTLDRIAYDLDVNLDLLAEINGITDIHNISAGQCLVVPGYEQENPDGEAEPTVTP